MSYSSGGWEIQDHGTSVVLSGKGFFPDSWAVPSHCVLTCRKGPEISTVSKIQCIGFLFSLKPLLGLSASCSSWERQPVSLQLSSSEPDSFCEHSWEKSGLGLLLRKGSGEQWLYNADLFSVPSAVTLSQAPVTLFPNCGPSLQFSGPHCRWLTDSSRVNTG